MSKHPAQDTQEPPGRDGRPETGVESHPRNSGREKAVSNKWHIWRPAFAYAAQQWFVDCPTWETHDIDSTPDCRCDAFGTWRAAMDYVNREIRVYQQAARARFIEVRPGATPSATDVRVVFRCPACASKGA